MVGFTNRYLPGAKGVAGRSPRWPPPGVLPVAALCIPCGWAFSSHLRLFDLCQSLFAGCLQSCLLPVSYCCSRPVSGLSAGTCSVSGDTVCSLLERLSAAHQPLTAIITLQSCPLVMGGLRGIVHTSEEHSTSLGGWRLSWAGQYL